jgi:DNA-3-methyladenine glycosylase II
MEMVMKITKITLAEGARELGTRDKDFERLVENIGLPGLRSRSTGYNTILKVICGQQISTSAAKAICARLDAIEDPMTAMAVLKLGPDKLRAAGLSGRKVNYAIGIAKAIENGGFNFRRVACMHDEAAIDEMIKLKGIGRWSAEVYLIFALRRPDVWPAVDLAILKGLMHLKKLKERPSRREMIEMAEVWRPWRSVAARLLWHHINWVERKK